MMEITPFDGDDVGGESASFPPSLSIFPSREREREEKEREKRFLN